MLKKSANYFKATNSSIKCPHCELINFADSIECRRCQLDLSGRSSETSARRLRAKEVGRRTFGFGWIFVGATVIAVLIVLYLNQTPTEVTTVVSESMAARTTVQEPAPMFTVEQEAASQEAVTKIVKKVKSFQDSAEGRESYEEFESSLNKLKSDLNDELLSFVRQLDGDQTFRVEVEATIREYTAAASWWKTTITYNDVFDEADRKERTQKNFESARTHFTNAVNALAR